MDILVVEQPFAGTVPQAQLQGDDILHQREKGARPHRVSHRDIDIPDPFRNGIQQGQQKVLVRKYEGGFDGCAVPDLFQDGRSQLDLAGRRRNADDPDVRDALRRLHGKGLGEFGEIPLHEEGRLVERMADHQGDIVPAELRHAGVPHFPHQDFLALVQGIQSDENELLLPRENRFQQVPDRDVLQAGRKIPVDHPLIGHGPFFQMGVEPAVQGIEDVPDPEEPHLDVPVRVHIDREPAGPVPEMGQETVHGVLLVLREIGITVLDRLEIGNIREKVLRVREIFVDVVEIREDDVSPEDELVQRLRLRENLPVTGVQFDQETDPVGRIDIVDFVEEVIDRQHRRGDEGSGGHSSGNGAFLKGIGERLPEEGHGPPVRKDKADIGNGALGKIPRGDLREKTFHIYKNTIVLEKSCTRRKNFLLLQKHQFRTIIK